MVFWSPRIALLSVVALIARTAQAEILLPGASLAVKNPPSMASCVDETALGARIRSQLSNAASPEPALRTVKLDVAIQRTLTTLVADLRMSGRAGGTRQIEAARCEGLTEALAVTLAMILDQDAKESRVAPAASPVPAASAAPAVSAEQNVSARPADVAARSAVVPTTQAAEAKPVEARRNEAAPPQGAVSQGFRLGVDHELRAWFGGGYGSSSSWVLEAGGAYAYRAWAMQLGAFYQPKRETALGVGRLELTAVGGVAEGCRRFGGDWRFVPCVRATLGMERAAGSGFDHSSPQRMLVGSVGPTLGVESGSRWVAGLELIGQLGWWRDEYVVENPQQSEKAPLFVAWLVARVALSSRAAPAVGR